MPLTSISPAYLPQEAPPASANLMDLLLRFVQGLSPAPAASPTLPPDGLGARAERQTSLQELGQGWAGIAGGPTASFSPQVPGLAPGEQVVLPDPVQIQNAPGATRLSTNRITVLDRNLRTGPSGLDAQGNLVGPQGAVQSLVAAEITDDLFRDKLGRDFRYDTPDGRLSIDLDAAVPGPQAVQGGDIQFNNRQLAATADPDIVAHEAGHKLLFSLRPGLSQDLATQSTHEAFGDTVSLFTSLRDPSVRADLLARLDRGQTSSLASVVGESLPGPNRPGVRDLAGPLPRPGDPSLRDPHEAGKPFGQAIFGSVLDVAGSLRQSNPALSADQALAEANEMVSGSVIRAIDMLPQRGSVGPGLFAQAVLQADQGPLAGILMGNFRRAGVL